MQEDQENRPVFCPRLARSTYNHEKKKKIYNFKTF